MSPVYFFVILCIYQHSYTKVHISVFPVEWVCVRMRENTSHANRMLTGCYFCNPLCCSRLAWSGCDKFSTFTSKPPHSIPKGFPSLFQLNTNTETLSHFPPLPLFYYIPYRMDVYTFYIFCLCPTNNLINSIDWAWNNRKVALSLLNFLFSFPVKRAYVAPPLTCL